MIIRDEIPDDVPLIATVVIEAFRTAASRPGRPQPPDAGLAEKKIVEGLRASKALTLSLVAVEDGDEIVGHVAFSPVLIDRRDCNWFGMAPVSVWPECQSKGIGSKLVRAGIERMRARGAAGIVVLGNPAYYQRFGFRAREGLLYPGPPAEYFMALSFTGAFPSGTVQYNAAFAE